MLCTDSWQIDFYPYQHGWRHVLQDVASCMDMALASHHFPIIVQLDVAIPKRVAQPRAHQFDVASLESHVVGNRFRELFQSEMESLHADHLSADEMCANMRICYEKAAGECLPKVSCRARKPWIANPNQGRNILAYHKDVHCHLSCSQSWWPCSSLTRRLNSQWKLKPGNPVSFLPMNWFTLTIHWWLPRTLVEQKHIWDALKQWE